mgnify:CR=1 FL=1
MVIVNNTDQCLYVTGIEITPNERITCCEMMFNTCDILSDIGSVEITTEYSIRSFRNFGQLRGFETEDVDEIGLKIIQIDRIEGAIE